MEFMKHIKHISWEGGKLEKSQAQQVGAPTVPSAFIANSGEWGH
jgi:hypothetical protein